MRIYTIGFTKKSAREFFDLVSNNGVGRMIDIRLHAGGQLAGFTKQNDLAYFLSRLVDCEYHHLDSLSPTESILSEYRETHDWDRYVQRFEALMNERRIPQSLDRSFFEKKTSCLLCSEASPERCHRRLVAERFAKHWSNVEIIHL